MESQEAYQREILTRVIFDTLRTPSIPQTPPMLLARLTRQLMAGRIWKDSLGYSPNGD